MIKNSYELEVLVNGKPLREYYQNYKTFVEGKKGSIFSVRLRNNSSEKVVFIPTVDGLSVIDGKDASYESRGYIVEANSAMLVDGWRMNDNQVAEFYFSSSEQSYRKRSGKGNNTGSIAVAVFREKQKPIIEKVYIKEKEYIYPSPRLPWPTYPNPYGPVWMNTAGNSTDAMYSCSSVGKTNLSGQSVLRSATQEIGTGFGSTKHSEVISASFDREDTPTSVLEVFYNTREQLKKLGIEFDRQPAIIAQPNSFPSQKGYCEPPRN